MKRLLTSATLFLCSLLTFAQFSGSGSGTESDPYLILNPIQLNQLRNFLNQDGVYFKLMADIDLTEFLEDENPDQGWQPVGNSSSAVFKGIFDGNGKAISGLWIKRSNTNNVGFFGYTDGATIKNVIIETSVIEGKESVGGFSGYSQGTTISGCSLSGTVKGVNCVGGYVGNSGDNMTLSANTAFVNVTGTGNSVGGFIGCNYAGYNLTISGCVLNNGVIRGINNIGGCCGENKGNHNYSNVISNTYIHANIFGDDYVGGICGLSENYLHVISPNNCGFIGYLQGKSFVGGLVGKISIGSASQGKGEILNSFAVCDILATGNYVGGLIGYDTGSYNPGMSGSDILGNYHSGSITGVDYVGGLVGYKKYHWVSNCYKVGSVKGNKHVGGLLGYQEGYTTLKKSVAINTRITATTGDVNRVVGYNKGTIGAMGSTDENKSYNRTIVINQGVAQDVIDDEQNGTGVSATTLMLKATYVAMGWDFTDTWEIQETECYPYFKTQTAPPVITSRVVSGATTVSGKCVDGGTITLEIDGVKQQKVSASNSFSFTVSPLQAGHEVRVSAKADGKEQSYYTTEVVSFLGKGTEADPYQISTAADLTQVYRKGYYKLMNDIDLTEYISQFSPTEGWQSIGRDGSETIHFDGAGHKVTGLWCNSTRDNTGLFSCFANGTIKDLSVETANGKQVKGGANTGILIGKLINGTIVNCKVVGRVADGTPVGGMVGVLDGGSINKCLSDVTINTTETSSYVGGLVGETTSGMIDQCVTAGALKATGTESYVGGIIGKNNATVINSYSTANVTSSYNAAGAVAYNYGVVEMCYATGNLYSNNYAAGIIGYNDGSNAIIRNCVAMNKKIEVRYESQQVQQGGGYGQRIIGGIKNEAPAPELDNYALKTMQVSINDVPQKVYDDIMNGVAKSDLELKTKSTFQEIGWDFITVWSIAETNGYPRLMNNTFDDAQSSGPNEDDPLEIDDTDISLLANAIYTSSAEVQLANHQFTLPIQLKNRVDVVGVSLTVKLPDGMTLVKDEDGDIVYKLNEERAKSSKFSVFSAIDEDGACGIRIMPTGTNPVSGTDGTLLTLTVQVADTLEAGAYPILLTDNSLSVKDNEGQLSTLELENTRATLSIITVQPGDVNADERVDLTDAIMIVYASLGVQQPGFSAAVADMNGDSRIDLTDAITVVYISLGVGQQSREAYAEAVRQAFAKVEATVGFDIRDVTVAAGGTVALPVGFTLNTDEAVVGFQLSIDLPDGVTTVTDEDGLPVCTKDETSCPKLTIYPTTENGFAALPQTANASIKGTSGTLFTVTLQAADSLAAGTELTATVTNAMFTLKSSDGTMRSVDVDDFTFAINIGESAQLYGDLNGDGEVGIGDIVAVTNVMAGNGGNITKEQADVNGDGEVGIGDVVAITNIMAGSTAMATTTYEYEYPDEGLPRNRMSQYNDGSFLLSKTRSYNTPKASSRNTATSSQEVEEVVEEVIAGDTSPAGNKVFEVVEQMPSFPGGDAALMQFLSKAIKYPVEAENNGIQGRVVATFVIERDGSISEVSVVKSVAPSLDQEAIRVLKSMPKWIPGFQNGKPVRVKYTTPVTFRLQ